MKTIPKIKTILSSLLLVVFISSCNDLDQEFYGHLKDEDLWNSKTDYDQAINGAIRYLDQPYGYYTMNFFLMEDAATDYFDGNSNEASEYTAFNNWRTNYPTNFSWAVWSPLYQSVYQCNLVLERLDKFPVRIGTEFEAEDLVNKSKIEGQARFFRALNYYFAQNYFGAVPIVTSSDDKRTFIAKSDRNEVRLLIESDLISAADLLPNSVDAKADVLPSRPSKQAAFGLLARLYINWENRSDRWKKASDACDAVINNPSDLGLEPVYSDIFSLSKEKNKEMVFVIEHNTATGVSGNFLLNNYTYSPSNMLNPIGAQVGWNGNWQVKKATLYSIFDTNDVRKKQILASYPNKSGGTTNIFGGSLLVNKYPLDSKNVLNSFGGNDQPIIRYADIILMKAEAQNRLANLPGTITLINQIRTRAGLTNLPASMNTFDLLSEELYKERRREFFFEGLGRTDMIRFTDQSINNLNRGKNKFLLWVAKKTGSAEGTEADVKFKLYPFDALALRNNEALIQNSGYTN
jgi:hypothetical protein